MATLPPDHTFDRTESVHTFTNGLALRIPDPQTTSVIDTAIPGLTAGVSVTVLPR